MGGLTIDRIDHRVRYQMMDRSRYTPRSLWLMSDGKTVNMNHSPDEQRWIARDAPGNLDDMFLRTFLRRGAHQGLDDLFERVRKGTALEPTDVRNFSFLRFERMENRDYAVIRYPLNDFRSTDLWIDLSTHLPFKRMHRVGMELRATLTETYSYIQLNGPMVASTFEVPK